MMKMSLFGGGGGYAVIWATVCCSAATTPRQHKLKFTFERPLANERYCFYVITEDCPGAEVKFHADPQQGDWSPEMVGSTRPTIECRDLPQAPELRRKRDLLFTILDITGKIIRTDLYLTRVQSGGSRLHVTN